LPSQEHRGGMAHISEVCLSPDGRQLAYVDGAGLWLKWLNRIAPSMLISGNARAASPFWSPDGEHIGWCEDQKILRRPISGGQTLTIGSFDTPVVPPIGGAVWLRDDRIVGSNADGPLFVFPALGGKREVLVPLGEKESDFHKPARMPGHNAVLFLVHGADGHNTIAYWDPVRGRKNVYTVNAQNRVGVLDIGYAPSGHLLYTDSHVWAVSFSLPKLEATGDPIRIFEGFRGITVADDGTLGLAMIELEETQLRGLIWINRKGTLLQQAGAPESGLYEPQLSPDESKISFSSTEPASGNSRIWVFDLLRNSATPKSTPGFNAQGALWDTAGKGLLYARGGKPNTEIVSAPLEGGGAEKVLIEGMLFDTARNGDLLLLLPQGRHPYLTLLDRASSNQPAASITLTNLPGGNLWVVALAQPRLAPNGKALACVLTETEREEIYCLHLPEAGEKEMISRGGGKLPIWRADGQELFYLGGNGRKMMAVSVTWDNAPHFGEPHELFQLPDSIVIGLRNSVPLSDYAVSHDGERFLMMRRSPEAESKAAFTPALYLVQNWSEEYKKELKKK
jgi:hypothetical protein